MPTIIIGHLLLDSLKSIGETSFDDLEINSRIDDACNVAAVEDGINEVDPLWKTIERSPGRVDIARRVEAGDEKIQGCQREVRIDSERSQFGPLRILPQTQCHISRSDSLWDLGVVRIEFLRPLKISQRALPFAAPTVDTRAILSSQRIVGLQLQCAVELRQRVLVLAMPVIKEHPQRQVRFR